MTLIVEGGAGELIAWRESGSVSRGEFVSMARHLSQVLPDAPAYLNLCDDRFRFMLGFAAIVLRGGVNLLPPSLAPEALSALRNEYPGCGAIADRPIPIPGREPFVFDDTRNPVQFGNFDELSGKSVPDDFVVAVAYTSGSSGRPQGHPKRWIELVSTALLARERLFASLAHMNVVGTVPPQHMYGFETLITMALVGGTRTSSASPFFPRDIAEALLSIPAPRALITTPLQLRACLQVGIALAPLERIVSATAPLDENLARRVELAFGCEVHEIYGCTEAGSIATRRTVSGDLWRPHVGSRIESIPAGSRFTAPVFTEAVPLQDHAEVQCDGRFRLLGRASDLIKVAGKRASLSGLTASLLAIPGVQDAVVFVPDEKHGREARPAALVVAPSLTSVQLARELARKIDSVLVPRPIRLVERLPHNALGKLPRAALIAALEGVPE